MCQKLIKWIEKGRVVDIYHFTQKIKGGVIEREADISEKRERIWTSQREREREREIREERPKTIPQSIWVWRVDETRPERKRRSQSDGLDQSCILVSNMKENPNSLGVAMEQLKQIYEDL